MLAVALVITLVAAGACSPPADDATAAREEPVVERAPAVRPGIEVLLRDSLGLIEGRRVGLITSRTAVGGGGRSSIDLLRESQHAGLVALLFAPEHGVRADEDEGATIPDGVDGPTGLPILSLYGESLAPTPEMLSRIDVLLFDLQDVGARYYTYVSTMAYAMRAAGEAGVPFVVLDRPDPIGGAVQGPVLDPAFATFVGLFPVPVRHGMTAGELARLYVGEFGIDVDLTVVPAEGWRRGMWFDETGLPWIPPSPNMPTLESATHYPGTCLFEGTNLSVGRGTPEAFREIGAPWLDGEALAARLGERDLPGVRIDPVTFTPDAPSDGKYGGLEVSGIRLTVTDRDAYDPVVTAVAALIEARALAGDRWEWNAPHFDRLAGSDGLRTAIEAGASLDEVTASWPAEVAAFERLRRPYLLYPP